MPFFFSLIILLTTVGWSKAQQELPQVLISTTMGDIMVELYPQQAPVTVENFLKYVDQDLAASASFYRVVTMENQPNNDIKIEVIQGGFAVVDTTLVFGNIAHETTQTTGLKHQHGTLSMARNKPGSASSEIFICINNQPELDYGGMRNPDGQGFAAFGQVIGGMDVVLAIQQLPVDNQSLQKPVQILAVQRIK